MYRRRDVQHPLPRWKPQSFFPACPALSKVRRVLLSTLTKVLKSKKAHALTHWVPTIIPLLCFVIGTVVSARRRLEGGKNMEKNNVLNGTDRRCFLNLVVSSRLSDRKRNPATRNIILHCVPMRTHHKFLRTTYFSSVELYCDGHRRLPSL